MFLLLAEQKVQHPMRTMCRLLGVSPSGYYAWRCRKPSAHARRDAELAAHIRQIHEASRTTYGAPRVYAELILGRNIRCGRKRVARLMRAAGLTGVHRRRTGAGAQRRRRGQPRACAGGPTA